MTHSADRSQVRCRPIAAGRSLFFLGSVAALLVVAAGCSGGATAKTSAPAPTDSPGGIETVVVTVAPIEIRALQRRVELVGNFEGFEEVVISSKVDGIIRKIYHEAGDLVTPGNPLLEIDDTDYRLMQDEARQALAADLARLGLTALPEGELEITRLPSVERARAMLANAEIKFGRAGSLATRNAITPEMRDQSEADFNVARAEYRQAELEARATLASARHKAALLASAGQRLRDARILVPEPTLIALPGGASPDRAAADGALPVAAVPAGGPPPTPAGRRQLAFVVAERMVSEGELVQSKPNTELFRLVIDDPLKLRANVPERFSDEVKVGQKVEIRGEAAPDELFFGTVSRISPTVNRASRTFQVEVVVENGEHRLKPGNFAKAAIVTRQEDRAVTVPLDSLVSFAGVNKVFVVRDGKAWAVEVRPAVRGDGWLEVVGTTADRPLEQGALVVTSGATRLADGTPVRVRAESTGRAGATP